jgi:glucose dehydrogenase
MSWPTYGATYENTRHVNARQIDENTVHALKPAWQFVMGGHERVETTPIVVGRTMYLTTGVGNNVIALDAKTGALKWRYRPTLGFLSVCCGAINRGVAVTGGRVFFATLDAQLIALDAASGKPVWHVYVGDSKAGFSETMAPLAWKGVVYVGSSGSDNGIRGSVSAYRASDGKLLWRWYSVSRGWEGAYVARTAGKTLHRNITQEKRSAVKYPEAWAHGGGSVWMTPALDTRTGTLYAATSNPSPVFDGNVRPGDNLYTDSIVALDARTGKLRWYYQQTPHDVWEYEASSPPVLFDVTDAQGKRVPAVGEAGKTRWLYILDRRDGSLLRLSQSFGANAHLYDDPPSERYTRQLPLRGSIGPIAYDPSRHLALITAIEHPTLNRWREMLTAIDVDNGRVAWRRPLTPLHEDFMGDRLLAGSLSAGGLVFVSSVDGNLFALDSGNGAVLWQYALGAGEQADTGANILVRLAHRVRDWLLPVKREIFHQDAPTGATASVDANPIAYELDGREYIALAFDAQPERSIGGATICVFALNRN